MVGRVIHESKSTNVHEHSIVSSCQNQKSLIFTLREKKKSLIG